MTREHAKKILTHLRNGKSDLMLMDALDMAISALSEKKNGEWIPIEERKPKHRQEVFVTYETEDGIRVDKTTYHERHGFAISSNVTAWREMPEPYKGE